MVDETPRDEHDVPHGTWIHYYSGGGKYLIENYHHGKLNGKQYMYHANGNQWRVRSVNMDNIIYECTFDYTGKKKLLTYNLI